MAFFILFFFSKKIESPFESRPKIPRESPFESKPKLARTSSYNNKKNGETTEDMVYVDYNPSSGVTFRENKNSDVQVVGKGYNEDGTSLDSRSLNGINRKANDKRRVTKGKATHCAECPTMHLKISCGCLLLYDFILSMVFSFGKSYLI